MPKPTAAKHRRTRRPKPHAIPDRLADAFDPISAGPTGLESFAKEFGQVVPLLIASLRPQIRERERRRAAAAIFAQLIAKDASNPPDTAIVAVAYADLLTARLELPVAGPASSSPQNTTPAGG